VIDEVENSVQVESPVGGEPLGQPGIEPCALQEPSPPWNQSDIAVGTHVLSRLMSHLVAFSDVDRLFLTSARYERRYVRTAAL
jgi:hypothetical protein